MQDFNREDYERIHLQEMIFLGEEALRIEQEFYEELRRSPAQIIVNINQEEHESNKIQEHY